MNNIQGFRVLLNHFDEKPTFLFKFRTGIVIVNGCQTFREEDKERIFDEFEVHLIEQEDVNNAIEDLRYDTCIRKSDFYNVIDTFNFYQISDLLIFVDWKKDILEYLIREERMRSTLSLIVNPIFSILDIDGESVYDLSNENITKIAKFISELLIPERDRVKLLCSFHDIYVYYHECDGRDVIIKDILIEFITNVVSWSTLISLMRETYMTSFISKLLVESLKKEHNSVVESVVEQLYNYLPRVYEDWLCDELKVMLNEYKESIK